MKRELKLGGRSVGHLVAIVHCRAYPDEKGIETMFSEMFRGMSSKIAEPIPMKRELKRNTSGLGSTSYPADCRAYPDEKGIETGRMAW